MVLGIGIVISVAFFITAVIDPNWLGRQLGTTAVVYFLWAAICIPVGSLIVYFSTKHGIPGLTLLFLWAVFSSYFNDNHAIETVQNGQRVEERPAVAKALRAWIHAHKNAEAPIPLIIVATAGGGSRAAYWTASVLGALEDKWPGFGDKVFAISGVSGGSVGAVVYKALHQRSRTLGSGTLCTNPKNNKPISSFAICGQMMLERDFLAPTVVALLYPDLVQRFVPFPLFNDRAHALERSFAQGWAAVVGSGDNQNGWFPFLDMWPDQTAEGKGSWPALFLNGTWVESGQRVITSNLYIERRDPRFISNQRCVGLRERDRAGVQRCSVNGTFVRVQDLLHRIQTDVPVWTAANNSARFPLVEPVGTLNRWDAEKKRYVEKLGHIADGGYFENYGAATALEIVEEAVRVLKAEESFHRFRIVVIQISSDPTISSDGCMGEDNKPALRLAPEIRGPVRTFLKTREARGLVAFGALCDRVERLRTTKGAAIKGLQFDRFIHLRMCPPGKNKDKEAQAAPPLSWMLSKQAQRRIQGYLPKMLKPTGSGKSKCNEQEFARLKAVLGPPK